MADLNTLIVRGASRLLNTLYGTAAQLSEELNIGDGKASINQEEATFNIPTTFNGSVNLSTVSANNGDFISLNGDDANFNNAYVRNLRATKYDLQHIALLKNDFIISPAFEASSEATLYISSISGNTITATLVDEVSIIDDSIGGARWLAGSLIKVSGTISNIDLGTCDGLITANMNTDAGSLTFRFDSAEAINLVEGNIYNSGELQDFTIMLCTIEDKPIGIYMTAFGTNENAYIDIYGGTKNEYVPVVRMGNLNGLPYTDNTGQTVSLDPQWGFYAGGNAYIEGHIVTNSGLIGGWAIGSSSIHTKGEILESSAPGSVAIASGDFSREINGVLRNHLRIAAGNGFGVGNNGELYAYSGEIAGNMIASGISANNITTGYLNVERIRGGSITKQMLSSDITTDIENAARTATNYLYYDSDVGLILSQNENQSGWNTQITGEDINLRNNDIVYAKVYGGGLNVYQDGIIVGSFGSTAQLGALTDSHGLSSFNTYIDSEGVKIRYGTEVISQFGKDRIILGIGDSDGLFKTEITNKSYTLYDADGNDFLKYSASEDENSTKGVVIRGDANNARAVISGAGMYIADLNDRKIFNVTCDKMKTNMGYSDVPYSNLSANMTFTHTYVNEESLTAVRSPLCKIADIEAVIRLSKDTQNDSVSTNGTVVNTNISINVPLNNSYFTYTLVSATVKTTQVEYTLTSEGVTAIQNIVSAAISNYPSSYSPTCTTVTIYTIIMYEPYTSFSFGIRDDSEAIGDNSYTFGYMANASGSNSYAFGYTANASGDYSMTFGKGTKASHQNQFAFGQYNLDNQDYLFEIGNGTDDNDRSDAFYLTKEGNGWFHGQIVANNSIIANGITSTNGYLKLKGTSSCTLNVQLTESGKSTNVDAIKCYAVNGWGMNLLIESAGNVIIGSGESVTNLYNNGAEGCNDGGERLFLSSDGEIRFITNAQDYTQRNVIIATSTYFAPATNGGFTLGTSSLRWGQIYSTASSISTSDRNEKHDIVPMNNIAKDFIMNIPTVTYKYNNGTSGRTHFGMIAQDIEDVMNSLHMTSNDFAGFIKSPVMKVDANNRISETEYEHDSSGNIKYTYGLRYEEFIAPMIKTIQLQQEEINDLKSTVKNLKTLLQEQLIKFH